ncbi:Uncharacterised protein [Chlamydia trachomatis]|nr:Uncharacterised protein [Chlamydia trachomatis]
MVVNIVEESFDVTFDKPIRTSEKSLDGTQSRMTASSWSESMRGVLKMPLIDSFKNKSNDLLHHLVFN